VEVKVNLIALVFVGLQRGEICGLTLFVARGVGGAGDGAGHTDADFSPFSSATGTMLISAKCG
jgi:hypothetical protein